MRALVIEDDMDLRAQGPKKFTTEGSVWVLRARVGERGNNWWREPRATRGGVLVAAQNTGPRNDSQAPHTGRGQLILS